MITWVSASIRNDLGVSSPKDLLCLAIFAVWFLLTVIRQLKRRKPRWLGRIDPLRIVPSWRLFGPRPPSSDYRFEVKCKPAGGEGFVWIDITPHKPRTWRAFGWNPQRRLRKTFNACANSIWRALRKKGKKRACRTPAYHLLAKYATSLSDFAPRSVRRFRIVRRERSAAGTADMIVFTSRRLGRRRRTVAKV
jgi:hypothetical protein